MPPPPFQCQVIFKWMLIGILMNCTMKLDVLFHNDFIQPFHFQMLPSVKSNWAAKQR